MSTESHPDFVAFFKSLNTHGVEYVIVGGYAVGHHGWPRYTNDMNVYAAANPADADRVIAALTAFGFAFPNLTADDFSTPRFLVRLGQPPVQIDVRTDVPGVEWDQVWASRSPGVYGGEPVNYIGREMLIVSKRKAGRLQDLADIEHLGEEV